MMAVSVTRTGHVHERKRLPQPAHYCRHCIPPPPPCPLLLWYLPQSALPARFACQATATVSATMPSLSSRSARLSASLVASLLLWPHSPPDNAGWAPLWHTWCNVARQMEISLIHVSRRGAKRCCSFIICHAPPAVSGTDYPLVPGMTLLANTLKNDPFATDIQHIIYMHTHTKCIPSLYLHYQLLYSYISTPAPRYIPV